MKKRILSLIVVVGLLMTMLVGCGEKEAGPEEDGTKVGLVLAGGLGDKSFYDSANEGVEKAVEDLGVIHKVYECRNDPNLQSDQLVQASEDSDIVVVVGYEFYDLVQEVSGEFKDVDYIYVDNEIPGIDNLITISYAENEGSFLAGALAAMLTSDGEIADMNPEKIIGMIGGEDLDVIRNFQVGYEAGAKYVDEDIKVITMYAEDFEDPAKGKEIASVIYSQGADIIFQVAGKTGEGVFEAAEEMSAYAIGVDTDQRHIKPDRIVASMVKEVGKSIYETIENIGKDNLERGEVIIYSLEKDGVGMGYGDDSMVQIVDEKYKEEVGKIKEKILAGEIKVPTAK